ncbi:MAG: hypothetical protein PHD36_00600 [Desulfotomaculaceae bacterium]|nr:hypothetical protein [Desulfotomaculaceae bacterium]
MNTIYLKVIDLIKCGINLLTKRQTLPYTMPRIGLELDKDINPLTELPGKILLQQELNMRTEKMQKFSIIHVRLCKKKYDCASANHIIIFTSKVLSNVVDKYGGEKDFIAHIMGDVFIIITQKKRADSLCKLFIRHFDNLIRPTCKQLEPRIKRNKIDLPNRYPFISMAIIDVREGEKPYIGNITSRAERLSYYKRSNHGSIFIHEPKL